MNNISSQLLIVTDVTCQKATRLGVRNWEDHRFLVRNTRFSSFQDLGIERRCSRTSIAILPQWVISFTPTSFNARPETLRADRLHVERVEVNTEQTIRMTTTITMTRPWSRVVLRTLLEGSSYPARSANTLIFSKRLQSGGGGDRIRENGGLEARGQVGRDGAMCRRCPLRFCL